MVKIIRSGRTSRPTLAKDPGGFFYSIGHAESTENAEEEIEVYSLRPLRSLRDILSLFKLLSLTF